MLGSRSLTVSDPQGRMVGTSLRAQLHQGSEQTAREGDGNNAEGAMMQETGNMQRQGTEGGRDFS